MKIFTMALLLVLAGCSSTATTQKVTHYHPTPSIIQAADDSSYWVNELKVPPKYPNVALAGGTEGCAKIGFTITPEGIIADPFVMKSIPKGAFEKTSIEAALKFKYKPSETNKNRVPVISSNTFTYGLDSTSHEYLSSKCNK